MAAGIISANINRTDPLKSIVGYNAEKTAVDPTKETVQGQVSNVINKNSDVMKLASTRAKQGMAGRGLLNSSIAVQAGQAAVLDAALPIAQQDAATYTRNKEANQNAGNQALQFTAGSQNQGALQQLTGNQNLESIGAQGEQQRLNIGAQTAGESQLIKERGEIDIALQTADAATKERLLNRQAEIDTNLQQLRGTQESQLVRERGEIEKQLQTADASTRERLLNRQAEIDTGLQQLRGQQETSLQTQRGQQESQLVQERGEIEKQLQTADIASREGLLTRQAQIDREMQELRGSQETGLQEMRGTQATELAAIENENQRLLQSSQNASALYQTHVQAINAILTNPDIPLAQKSELIRRQNELLRSGLAVAGGITEQNFGDLLNFGADGRRPPSQITSPSQGAMEDYYQQQQQQQQQQQG